MNEKKQLSYNLISKYRGVLMGIAIISIIIFHFTEDCRSADYHFNGLIKLYYYALGSSGVDLFLILSGFGIFYSLKRNPNERKRDFYLKRYVRILIPYFIVAIPGWIWRTIIVGGGTIGDFFLDLSFASFFISGKIWFWFILLVCIMYIVSPFLFKFFDSQRDDRAVFFGTIISFIVLTAVNVILYIFTPGFFDDTNILLLRIFPYLAGLYLGRVSYKDKPVAKWVIIICCLSIFCIPLRTVNGIAARYVMTFFHMALFLLYMVLLEYVPLEKTKRVIIKALEWLGKYTLEIYLSHVLVRSVLNRYGLSTAGFKNEILMLLISFAVAILLKKFSEFLIGKIMHKVKA